MSRRCGREWVGGAGVLGAKLFTRVNDHLVSMDAKRC
jgi:hypothetical protein